MEKSIYMVVMEGRMSGRTEMGRRNMVAMGEREWEDKR